jgi:hypothetical protein
MAGLDPAINNPRRCGVWITRTSRVMTIELCNRNY